MPAPFRPLSPGEPIGVVALSGPVDPGRLAAGLAVLESWGHPVVVAGNLAARTGFLAGEDAARLAGLVEVLDRGARVVVAARGGYGVTRLAAHLPWQRLVREAVTLVGFSDLTALLNPLVARGGALQVHGPMVAAGLVRPANARRLHAVLTGELRGRPLFRFRPEQVVQSGTARGPAFAFNLTLLTALVGTPEAVDLTGAVVFLEEVGEPLYRLDRMLTHLRRSATFSEVKALICGGLHGCRGARRQPGEWRRMVVEAAPEGAVVVCDLPFGHGARNLAIPVGAEVTVDTCTGQVSWSD